MSFLVNCCPRFKVVREGFVDHTKSSEKTHNPTQGGAKSGALGAREAPPDARLAEVRAAWPTLPDAARRGILGIVRAAAAKTATKGAKP